MTLVLSYVSFGQREYVEGSMPWLDHRRRTNCLVYLSASSKGASTVVNKTIQRMYSTTLRCVLEP